jgi:hypothetical protein
MHRNVCVPIGVHMNVYALKCMKSYIHIYIYMCIYIYIYISYRGQAAAKVDKTVERIRSMEAGMCMYMYGEYIHMSIKIYVRI